MRNKIVAGNWKMNLLKTEAERLYISVNEQINETVGVEVIVFPPALFIDALVGVKGAVKVGVQNFYEKEKGAFTGEISVAQVKDIGAAYVLIGHSERRAYFYEDHAWLKEKVDSALEHGLTPVFCCGEPLEIREEGREFLYVKKQLEDSLFHLNNEQILNCVIAYEPVWAIGTGKTATTAQAEEMHAAIRSWLKERYSEEISERISILYGGSCNASNAKELFACPNVDGGLIGGASLQADTFMEIVNAF